ncbi:MAG TPA: FAD-dependent monooxygenase [Pirellulales bacterium]|jgi:2-polyprenyl-6-methoxyphenol hydroxylase-like FAD-dependent oxidoreductase|nr:FAD-dependent monooxygenase [Pirellulales bacterium]
MTVSGPVAERSEIDVPVLIVGAGPTGLVLALWLTRLGVRVRIVDKTAEAGTTSRALAVQARTLEFYGQLGIAQAVVERGVKIAGVNLWVRGSRRARVPLEKIGEGLTPYPFALVFPQDAHERLLIERLEALGVKVERRTDLVRFDQQTSGVRAVIKRPDGSEETCQAAYLAGCDGASSTVREGLGIGFPGGTYAGLFYVADVEAAGPVTDFELHVDLEEADLLLVFPMKAQGCVRLVGDVREEQGPKGRELTFDDVGRRAIEHLKLMVTKVNWFSTYKVHHRVAHRFRGGRAFLLGDAAHIHSPAGGQGMNTGIGDAVNLAWKLAAVLGRGAGENLLDSYELERIGFARRLVATTDRGFTLATAQGRLARFARTRLVPLLLPPLFGRPRIRRFLFRTVSQTGIEYRQSPLSEPGAGTIRGGDRLPWVGTGPGADNFAPLTSLDWQVHVYGQARAGAAEACETLGLAIHALAWTEGMKRAGLARDALYLIRPDGYVALAEGDGDPQRLGHYFAQRGLPTKRWRDEIARR